MFLTLRKSAIDPDLFEIVEKEMVLKEIPIRFRIYKFPRRFESIEAIERWIEDEEKKLSKITAYRLLGIRNQSQSELRKKLAQKGISDGVCQKTIEEIRQLGYISDDSFEIELIEKELRKGHGPLYVEMKLRSLGIESSRVRKIISEHAQREMIRKLIPKLRNPAAALQRRGFDLEIIFSELKNFSFRR